MEVFCEVRGESLADVEIGDPDFNYNPLMSFLMTVTTPMAEPRVEVPVWISGGALRPIATEIREEAAKSARS